MSNKGWDLKCALSTVSCFMSDIMDGLEGLGSQSPDDDIRAFLDGGSNQRVAETIFAELLTESWKTQVANSQFLVEFVVMKAKRDLALSEVQKIAELRGLTFNYLLESENHRETLQGLLGMFPESKVTLIGNEPDERGSVPIVCGKLEMVTGWRRLSDGISKGERIALVRYLE